MPWCLGTSGLVRASSMPWSHHCAAEFHTFCPLTTNSSPSRAAAPEAGEVGAGARLAEELTPRVLTGEQARDELALLLVGAERHERGPEHHDGGADEARARLVVRGLFLVDALLPRVAALAADVLGIGEAGHARVVARALPARPRSKASSASSPTCGT